MKISLLKYVIFVCILFLQSCKKENLTLKELDSSIPIKVSSYAKSSQEISSVISDTNFIELAKIIEKIVIINDTVPHDLTEEALSSINNQINEALTIEDVTHILKNYGIQNSVQLSELFNQLLPLTIALIEGNSTFKNLKEDDARKLISESLVVFFQENPILHFQGRADACSQAYANGMSDCDNSFAIHVGGTVLGAAILVIGTEGTGIFNAGHAVISGVGAAYASLYVCQRGVVRAWRICRGYAYFKFQTSKNIYV